MLTQREPLPALPEIGHSEAYYAKHCRYADRRGDQHAHEAYKVGQYITLARDPHLSWEEKLRYLRHALTRHCYPPALPDEEVWMFYRKLADLVRTHAGIEALRLASQEDDRFAQLVKDGTRPEDLQEEAEIFFLRIIPSPKCPDWFHAGDYAQLCLMRDQWV
jgi:hypothetical protein